MCNAYIPWMNAASYSYSYNIIIIGCPTIIRLEGLWNSKRVHIHASSWLSILIVTVSSRVKREGVSNSSIPDGSAYKSSFRRIKYACIIILLYYTTSEICYHNYCMSDDLCMPLL